MRCRTTRLHIERLESRETPSVSVVNPTTATFIDVDGDKVTITLSAGKLDATLFKTQATGVCDQLQRIDLSGGGFDRVNLSITADRRSCARRRSALWNDRRRQDHRRHRCAHNQFQDRQHRHQRVTAGHAQFRERR